MADNAVSGKPWPKLMETVTTVDLRTDVPQPARMYDYYLGGKDNFPADREAAEKVLEVFPSMRITTRQIRQFMTRATRHLVAEEGVRQFLDIGTGIPTSPNLHETAQASASEARVVYVDNDPIVLAHARALLTGTPQGRTAYLDADFLDPDRILASPEVRETLDLTRPVALSLMAILHFVPDSRDPRGIIARLLGALPSGSFLAITHGTADLMSPEVAARTEAIYAGRGIETQMRSLAEVRGFFEGLDLLDPGVTAVHRWRPDAGCEGVADADSSSYGAVARKP